MYTLEAATCPRLGHFVTSIHPNMRNKFREADRPASKTWANEVCGSKWCSRGRSLSYGKSLQILYGIRWWGKSTSNTEKGMRRTIVTSDCNWHRLDAPQQQKGVEWNTIHIHLLSFDFWVTCLPKRMHINNSVAFIFPQKPSMSPLPTTAALGASSKCKVRRMVHSTSESSSSVVISPNGCDAKCGHRHIRIASLDPIWYDIHHLQYVVKS